MNKTLFLALIASCLLRTPLSDAAVILQYHHVSDETPLITSISPKLFEQHLDYINQSGFQVWPLPKIVAALKSKESIPNNVVAITFDDAYDSIYHTVLPLLRKRNWPFTVFVAPQPIDQKLKHYMSWDQLRELAKNGATIANHTNSHTHMVRQLKGEAKDKWLARMAEELESTEDRLEKEIGTSPKLFAYPYGEYLPETLNLIDELNLTAFGQHSGAVDNRMPLNALPRFPMNNDFGAMAQFKTKLFSLPFPAKLIEPEVNLLEDQQLLSDGISIRFYPAQIHSQQIACYLSGHGAVQLDIKESTEEIIVKTEALPIPSPGRSRINCTAPSAVNELSGRFHWYSHYWMQKQSNGEWYPEP